MTTERVVPMYQGRAPSIQGSKRPADMDDATLLPRLRAGDAGALEALMETYWEPLVAYAKTLIGGGGADDAAQETFVRLWERRSEWRVSSSGSLLSLLYRITRNHALNEIRWRRVRQRWLERRRDLGQTRAPSPIEALQDQELRIAVERAITALPPRRREIFLLSRHHNLSYREIAEVMGIAPQTVANQMSSALSDLRTALDPLFKERTSSSARAVGSPS